jgi:hypothetical protein
MVAEFGRRADREDRRADRIPARRLRRNIAKVEEALEGKKTGDTCDVYLQPVDAFGDYDEKLVEMETRDKFPSTVEVGMRFEGEPVSPTSAGSIPSPTSPTTR